MMTMGLATSFGGLKIAPPLTISSFDRTWTSSSGNFGGISLCAQPGQASNAVAIRRGTAASARRGRSLGDRKSTRLNSSHVEISYAVFCLKKKKNVKLIELSGQNNFLHLAI